jgi:hypothetical protein
MSEFVIISIILLGIVLLDALGDGLRWIGKQVAHHTVEILREAIWLAMVVYFTGQPELIVMYITARIALFDPLINLIAGKGLGYVGSSSLYDRILKWFSLKVKEPNMLIWVIRVIAIIWFVAWILTK